ncbi:Aldose 1-epimerase [Zancudomyces culisetae]|uniref:Aldose 1-epimerase n=1 Tax=Zancudomyces culisetae TaxID=1213189 RepID=A0A1R1PZ75_ZANCU|nr:Aldose 1-epimerase [Zancudomyces culisetae]|eukprot:OMH86253.1 Aldose 1-epimerase [Zancudomyces culisetae]
MSVIVTTASNDHRVSRHVLKNHSGGLEVEILNYGARINSIKVKDKNNETLDIAMGFENFEELDNAIKNIDDPYVGAIVGRVAGSIYPSQGIEISDKKCDLYVNKANGASHHGGKVGFDKVVWEARILNQNPPSVEYSYLSKDNEEGYPGNLLVKVSYTVTDKNEIKMSYHANIVKDETSSAHETILNVTNHAYFNLSGFREPDIKSNYMQIFSNKVLKTDSNLIHTGELCSTKDTFEMDTNIPFNIGDKIQPLVDTPLRGFDHVFSIFETKTNDGSTNNHPEKLAAKVWCVSSGICLEVLSDEPGLVFYSGNWISPELKGKGVRYGPHCAFALESQRFNNAFSSKKWKDQVVLKKNQAYTQNTTYKLSLIQ